MDTVYAILAGNLSTKVRQQFSASPGLYPHQTSRDMVVYGIVVPILPLIVEKLGGDSKAVGFLFGCYGT